MEQSRESSCDPPLYLGVVAIEKGPIGSPIDKRRQIYLVYFNLISTSTFFYFFRKRSFLIYCEAIAFMCFSIS